MDDVGDQPCLQQEQYILLTVEPAVELLDLSSLVILPWRSLSHSFEVHFILSSSSFCLCPLLTHVPNVLFYKTHPAKECVMF